jgi:A/G-specific adenine glycosylase
MCVAFGFAVDTCALRCWSQISKSTWTRSFGVNSMSNFPQRPRRAAAAKRLHATTVSSDSDDSVPSPDARLSSMLCIAGQSRSRSQRREDLADSDSDYVEDASQNSSSDCDFGDDDFEDAKDSPPPSPPPPKKRRHKTSATLGASSRSGTVCLLQPLASSPSEFTRGEIADFRIALLDWYIDNFRELPWRTPPRYRRGGTPFVIPPAPPTQASAGSPYAIWVSEVMSQQTRLSVVVEYWKKWMLTFPTVEALAAGPLERVNELWAGLGYYRRAKMLLEGATQIVNELGGKLPDTVAGLRQVRGIGAYTAGAICSISFNVPVPAVDGNVERVLARMRPRILPNTQPSSTLSAKARVYEQLATSLVADIECAGDFNQGVSLCSDVQIVYAHSRFSFLTIGFYSCLFLFAALMELGATLCTPKRASCDVCPMQTLCGAYAEAKVTNATNIPLYVEQYPVKDMSRQTKVRDEVVLCTVVRRKVANASHKSSYLYLLLQRPTDGLLAGFWEPPNVVLSAALAEKHSSTEARKALMDDALLELLPEVQCSEDNAIIARSTVGETAHVFSHIKQVLHVEVLTVNASGDEMQGNTSKGTAFRWLSQAHIEDSAVATQMNKVLKLAFQKSKPTSRMVHGRKRAMK